MVSVFSWPKTTHEIDEIGKPHEVSSDRKTSVKQSSEKQGDEVREWAMIELQGMLETRHPVPLGGRFIGDLHFTQKDVPILIIGHHILYGKVMTLEKPYGIMVKESGEGGETTGYNITAVIKKKLLFKTRPKPIIANVPKKI